MEDKALTKVGDVFVDVGKYILTVVVFGAFINQFQWPVLLTVGIAAMSLALITIGVLFIRQANPPKKDVSTEIHKAVVHVEKAEVITDKTQK